MGDSARARSRRTGEASPLGPDPLQDRGLFHFQREELVMASLVEFERTTREEWSGTATVRVALAGCGAVGSASVEER